MLHPERKMRSVSNDSGINLLLSILLTVDWTSEALLASIPYRPHSLNCTLTLTGGPG